MAFDIDELFIQFNKASCYEHMGVGVNIYLHWCVSLLGPECAVCLRVCVCLYEIKSEYQQKNTLRARPPGLATDQIFKKEGLDMNSIFRGGLLCKRG